MTREQKAPVVVIGPMPCEIDYLASCLSDATTRMIGGYRFTKGNYCGLPVVAVKSLIGMVNSACAALLAIQNYQPSCILLEGTSGAHDPALHQYDIVLGERLFPATCYETRHRDRGQGTNQEEWLVPGVEVTVNGETGLYRYLDGDPDLLSIAERIPYDRGNVRRGTIASGDNWVKELDRLWYCHETFGTDCEEMEGFAVAQICAQMGVPQLDIRVISNSEYHPGETFSEDTALACQHFCLSLLKKLAEA